MSPVKSFELYGIFGYPLTHTLSPVMQEAAFKALGIKAFYLTLEMDRDHFGRLMRRISRLALKGFNVTVPYKETVIRHLDRLTPEASAVGAVNTVYRDKKQWIGANTDIDGFLMSLERDAGFSPRGKKAVILGAGGSARAVIYGLGSRGVRSLRIINRHEKRAKDLIKKIGPFFPKVNYEVMKYSIKSLRDALKDHDLVVNATSVGLKRRDPDLIPLSLIPPAVSTRRMLFFDLIYRPSQTRFLAFARRKGHRTSGGLGMLLYQGARAFEYWTKRKAPLAAMRRALYEAARAEN